MEIAISILNHLISIQKLMVLGQKLAISKVKKGKLEKKEIKEILDGVDLREIKETLHGVTLSYLQLVAM